MKLGAHLPIADLGAGLPTVADLQTYVRTAGDLGYRTISANDHLIWRHPWLDGPTALASVLPVAGDMTLATSVTLPVVRGPVVVAKMLMTLAALAPSSKVIAGLGPGSGSADYAAVGVAFEERWARFDEALPLVQQLVRGVEPARGRFYALDIGTLMPTPQRPPEVWFGSWGSDRRLRAMAAVADGWFASAYNLSPDQYSQARDRLDGHLRASDREPAQFPDAVATAWLYVTGSRREAERMLTEVLSPTLNRDPAELTHLPIGSPEHCAVALGRYAAAGAQEVLVWPLGDPVAQLELCAAAAAKI